jgi:hypothetical protein
MQRKYIFLLLAFSLIYTIAVYTTPVSHALLHKYHLTMPVVRMLDALIIIPLIIIWAIAFYGSSMFESYAENIRRSKDGTAFRTIVKGVVTLAVGSPSVSVITVLISAYSSRHLPATRFQVIVSNYLTMLVSVAGLYFIYQGAVQLSQLTRKKFLPNGKVGFNAAYIAFAGIYTSLFVSHLPSAKNIPLTPTSHAAYYTPTPILILTLLVPYLIAWYLGVLAIYLLRFYTQNIGGKLYSQAFRLLSYGLGMVIAGSIFVQLLSVYSGQLQNLSTASLIFLIYIFFAVISAGYIPIAMGAKKLSVIEKI